MIVERRMSILVSAVVAFVLLTALWNAFVRPAHPVRAGPASAAPVTVDSIRAPDSAVDRKSTRLNSSHPSISYAVFCLKKKKKKKYTNFFIKKKKKKKST